MIHNTMKQKLLLAYISFVFILVNCSLFAQSSMHIWDQNDGSLSDGAIHGQVWSNIGGPIKDALVFVSNPELSHLYGDDVSAGGDNWGDYWVGPLPSNTNLVVFAYHLERPFILKSEEFNLNYNENREIELDLSIDYTDPGFITMNSDFVNYGNGGVLHLAGFILRMITLLQQSQNNTTAQAIIEQLESLQTNNQTSYANPTLGFILDSSGSMSDNDLNDIRKTALINIIKDRLTGNEQVHIVDFDSDAHVCNSKISGWSKDELISAAKTIDSSGGTNVEAGLDVMSASLTKSGFSNNTGVMLLTDGKGEYKDAAQWYMNKGIKVYTVSFVGDADEVLLRNIAHQTGGIYMRADTADQICNLFNLFYDLLTGSSMFAFHQDLIHQGDVLDYYFPIDNVEGDLYFATNWSGSKVDMKIISPSGNVYTVNDGKGSWNIGDNYATASIPSKEIGNWEVQLIGSQIPQQGEEVSLEVHGKSDLLFNIDMNTHQGFVDFTIVSAMQHLVGNYSANVTVKTPNGKVLDISDKLNGNKLNYFPISGKGSYQFSFHIQGSRNDGTKFQRQLTRYYFAGEHAIPYISPITYILGNCVYADIGKVVGNSPGIKCYIYRGDVNNYQNCIAEGYVINCKDLECTAEIDYYLQNTKAQVGDILKLDEDDWRAD